MAHVLNKLVGVNPADVKTQLDRDAAEHAKQGMHLEHVWQNANNPDEIYFLFRVDDLARHKALMERIHAEARAANPDVTLPEKLFLEEV